MNQTTCSNRFGQKRSLGIFAAVIIFLIIALAEGLYLGENFVARTPNTKPTPALLPFDFRLDVSPANSTVIQGKSVQVNVTITYMKGSPENVTLNTSGIPDGTDYTFSQPQGTPRINSTFNCILTLHVSEAVPTNAYNITVNAIAENGKTYYSPYLLSVLSSKVSLSGTVSEGEWIPTQIIFEQLSPSGATVQTFTVPIQSGNYAISLPNKQFYQ
jgi:hypothetical protein